MPLVNHNNLPSLERVCSEGVKVVTPDKLESTLPNIRIGYLNMMPDAALAATERQFLRLVGANEAVNCHIYPFTIQGVQRSDQAQNYIDQYYLSYAKLKTQQIDALIITGANVSQPILQNETFWAGLSDVLHWGKKHTRSMLCSCLATHAAVKVFYDIDRQHLGDKCWGVYEHHLNYQLHPLLNGVDGQIKMCHSRFNDIPEPQFKMNEVDVLIKSEQVGVQLAAEQDMSIVYFQGHPEYDAISLLKEYKREIFRYLSGELDRYPPTPANYFNSQAMLLVDEYRSQVEIHQSNNNKRQSNLIQTLFELFPEAKLSQHVVDSWQDSSRKIFSNWINLIANL